MSMQLNQTAEYTRTVPTFLSQAGGDDETVLTNLQNPVEYICDTDSDVIYLPPEAECKGGITFIIVKGATGDLTVMDNARGVTVINSATPAGGILKYAIFCDGYGWFLIEDGT